MNVLYESAQKTYFAMYTSSILYVQVIHVVHGQVHKIYNGVCFSNILHFTVEENKVSIFLTHLLHI